MIIWDLLMIKQYAKRMMSSVCEEWGVSCGRMGRVIVSKLHHMQKVNPIILLIVDEEMKVLSRVCLYARFAHQFKDNSLKKVYKRFLGFKASVSLMMSCGRTWCLNTSRIKRFVISSLVNIFMHKRKCAILVKRSTTVRMVSNPLVGGSSLMKSNDIYLHGPRGIGNCCNKPYSRCWGTFDWQHTSQLQT